MEEEWYKFNREKRRLNRKKKQHFQSAIIHALSGCRSQHPGNSVLLLDRCNTQKLFLMGNFGSNLRI
jgi:hypothetical protein